MHILACAEYNRMCCPAQVHRPQCWRTPHQRICKTRDILIATPRHTISAGTARNSNKCIGWDLFLPALWSLDYINVMDFGGSFFGCIPYVCCFASILFSGERMFFLILFWFPHGDCVCVCDCVSFCWRNVCAQCTHECFLSMALYMNRLAHLHPCTRTNTHTCSHTVDSIPFCCDVSVNSMKYTIHLFSISFLNLTFNICRVT